MIKKIYRSGYCKKNVNWFIHFIGRVCMPVVTVNVWGNDEFSRAFCCQIPSNMANLILANIWPRSYTVLASLYSFPNRLNIWRNFWLAPECISLHTMIEFAHDTSSAWQIELPPHAVTLFCAVEVLLSPLGISFFFNVHFWATKLVGPKSLAFIATIKPCSQVSLARVGCGGKIYKKTAMHENHKIASHRVGRWH